MKTGTVIKTEGTSAIVELDACSSCEGCRAACLLRTDGKRTLEARNPIKAQISDRVSLKESDGRILMFSFASFIVPIILFIGSFVILNIFLSVSVSIGISCVTFLLSFFGLTAFINKRAKNKPAFEIDFVMNY